jgi:uncharacterized protein
VANLRFVILHGSYGHSRENWFPWLAERLREIGHDVVVPQFPTPVGQNLSTWLEIFDREAGLLSAQSVLVGHSLGAAFIIRVLERIASPVGAAFLVAAFFGPVGLPAFDSINATFVSEPVNWSRVKRSAKSFFVYGSDNDPYVRLDSCQRIAEQLGARFAVHHDAGHFNSESGYTSFPALLADIHRWKDSNSDE